MSASQNGIMRYGVSVFGSYCLAFERFIEMNILSSSLGLSCRLLFVSAAEVVCCSGNVKIEEQFTSVL
jgi:hypothetical protein